MDWHRILDRLLVTGCRYADVFLEKVTYSLLSLEDGRLEKVISGTEEGVGLRIIAGAHTFYAHTNDLEPGRVASLANDLAGRAVGGGPRILAGHKVTRAPAARTGETLEVNRRTELVRLAEKAARGHHPSVRQVLVSLGEKKQELTIFAPEREVSGERRDTVMLVQTVAAEGNLLQRGYETLGRSDGSAFLDEPMVEDLAVKSAARAVKMLSAPAAPAGTMPVVLSSEAGGTMVHEAIGHGLENDLAGQGLSVYSGKIGQMVASPLISVVDDPTLPGRRGSYAFDDEGTPSCRNILVEGGTLTGFISDIVSAERHGGSPTGNGRRQSFRHPPLCRMSNTLILPGDGDPQQIIRDTRDGLLVVKMGGGQVNTVNGEFVFEVSEGYRIEAGEVVSAVRGALLIGSGPKVLSEIDAVGSDLGFGVGTCGKDGQGVPVADAQPTLRIPRMTVGGQVA